MAIVMGFVAPRRRFAHDRDLARWVGNRHAPVASDLLSSVELANAEPFAPTLGVKIAELKTVMTYSLPSDEKPSLPQQVATRVRGRAFLFKSLDGDMTVKFSDYVKPAKK